MKPLVESLKRLFQNQKVSYDRIVGLFVKGTITKEEKDYILSDKR